MSLTAGARLGPYEVVAPLGAGGMGQVYRARDTQLGRDVAIMMTADGHTRVLGRFYDVTRDGQRFVMVKELPPPPGAPVAPAGPAFVVVVNWLQELRAAAGK